MIVIGAGRIGQALHDASRAMDIDCDLVSRDEGWDSLAGSPGEPVVVAVRNDDLEDVLDRVPRRRRNDLVFVQNGALGPWLRERNLGSCTRGLLYYAVAKRGDAMQTGVVPSVFTGKHAGTMAVWLRAMDVPANEVSWPEFLVEDGVKLGWLMAHGLLCELYDCSVGEIAEYRRNELTSLCQEITAVWRAYAGVGLEIGWYVERLCEYSRSIPDYRASVKEVPWRNGWMVRTSRRYRVATPLHDEMLVAAGHAAHGVPHEGPVH